MNPQEFIEKLAPWAVQEMKRTGILASITIAQGALESGWGAAAPGNNLFGIKGSGQLLETQEFINDHWLKVTDGFRVYKDWLGSVWDHSQFLIENERYARAGFFERCTEQDYIGAAKALQTAGYATDPSYADKLIAIIHIWDLHVWDASKDMENEVEIDMMLPEDANKVIAFLKAAYAAVDDAQAQQEFHRLANELRKVSGQPEE
ncbi:Flagellum-specific peptidoglycan hydrolase FlgJ [Paenibacillus sp. 1_12]|uniref:glycoside hydrolase family 73 protein n=1 Tax=Paenibacillus sp. 1_12 TaxID=1566278 RepID=UPI0008EBC61B|nr:glycoside hydrolase family 73 protein [Paenibacillus sp. 1_12]SFL09915.1 Flagellum-specific peptidoglycan hydrolase FlgJ [Paenibacillus sp. 1_12]